MNIHTFDELGDISGKYVLVRDDFNVQIVDGKITDAFRIEQSLPTLRKLIAGGAKIAIIAHLGRPKEREPELSLAPIAMALEQLLGRPVAFVSDCLEKDFLSQMKNGDVALLENLRYYPGEEKNDLDFAQKLANGFDYYVNDAFAVSHRAHASVDAIAGFLPSFAGELLASEIATLANLMENPKRPLCGIIGGSKVSGKIGVIKALARLCDKVIVAGGIGTSFRITLGAKNIKDMLYDEKNKDVILDIMKEFGGKIVMPISKGVGNAFAPSAARADKLLGSILADDVIMDEGPESIFEYEKTIGGARTVVWNGTVGMAEWQPTWSVGTFALARFVANKTAAGELESVIGGGDTVAALEAADTKDKMTYVSTGGGAFLEFIEGIELPGIKALEK
ncbi:MAG: phosphoglycerate kinase [Rickettsiales bacterium]|jgi:phosphoglycerate kinase|nr:phosphoglycerate kinase [Rickettsiales bacterium]